MAAKNKALMFADKLNISPKLPASMKTYLQGATLEQGRQALRTYRRTGRLPKTGLQQKEGEFAATYGGLGKLMRGGTKPRKRR